MGRLVLALPLAIILALVIVACGGSGASSDATSAAPAAAPTTSAATPAPEQGAQIFAAECAGCHGVDGNGGTGPGIRGEDNLARVKLQIESGGDKMPAFAGQLTPAQIEAVAQYLVTELQ